MAKQFLTMSIMGEFITNFAREKFYVDNDLQKAIEILRGGLMSDEITPNEQLILCLQILNGEAEIKGQSGTEEYGLYFKDNVDKDATSLDVIFETLNTHKIKLAELEHEYNELQRKFLFLCDKLTDYRLDEYNAEYCNEYGEPMFPDMKIPAWRLTANQYIESIEPMNSALESFIAQRHRAETEDTSEDYGWLEPDGTYHPVEWGDHSSWAQEYLESKYPYKEHADMYWKTDANGNRHHYVNGDCLVYVLGWVLIDNPAQGLGRPTYDTQRGLTKAQKEFLYDYYIKRGRNTEANALYQEDDF